MTHKTLSKVTLNIFAAALWLGLIALPSSAIEPVTLQAEFNASQLSPIQVEFSYATDTDDLRNHIWEFGDGTTSNLPHPTHHYYSNQPQTVQFKADSLTHGPIDLEMTVLIGNLFVEDDFNDQPGTLSSEAWHWPTGTDLEENFIDLGQGDLALAFPVIQADPLLIPDTDPSESDLICLEPPGEGGGPTLNNLLPKGFFRFDVVLDSVGLPWGLDVEILRLEPTGASIQLRHLNGFHARMIVPPYATPWKALHDGTPYRFEVEIDATLPGQGSLVMRIEDLSPGSESVDVESLNNLPLVRWSSLSLGAIYDEAGVSHAAEVGSVYLDNVEAYRHQFPSP